MERNPETPQPRPLRWSERARAWLRIFVLWLPVPSVWRVPAFDLLYTVSGPRFAGSAHYEAWLRNRQSRRPDTPAAPQAAKSARGIVVVVDQYIPRYDRDAGARALWQMMETLVGEGWDVKFWPNYRWYEPGYTEELEAAGIQVVTGPWYRQGFGSWLRSLGDPVQAVLVGRPLLAREYYPVIRRCSRARLLFNGVDIHFERLARQAQALGVEPGPEQRWMAKLEPRIWARSDVVLYPSESEVRTVWALCPQADARWIPLFCFDTFGAPRMPVQTTSARLLIVANFGHVPNVDGVRWFLGKVLPLLRLDARSPAFTLRIVGAQPPPALRDLADPGVEWLGAVSDAVLDALYRESHLSLVPLRFGAGVKGKVVESLRWGLPLVTTPTGIQGLPGLEGVVRIAEEPADFARAVGELLQDPSAAARMSAAMIDYARRHFTRGVMRAALSFEPVTRSG